MRDDDPLTDVERRLSRRLRGGDDAVARVIAAALAPAAPRVARRRVGARVIRGSILVLVIAIAVLWRGAPRAPSPLLISGYGAVVVVTSDDGRRWLIQAQQSSHPRGEYVIAFPQ